MKKLLCLSLLSCFAVLGTQLDVEYTFEKDNVTHTLKNTITTTLDEIRTIEDEKVAIELLIIDQQEADVIIVTNVYEKNGNQKKLISSPVVRAFWDKTAQIVIESTDEAILSLAITPSKE